MELLIILAGAYMFVRKIQRKDLEYLSSTILSVFLSLVSMLKVEISLDSVWLFVYMNEVKTTEQTSFLNHWLNWTEIH